MRQKEISLSIRPIKPVEAEDDDHFMTSWETPMRDDAFEVDDETKIEKIDGVKYYMHTVEAGQTVYSIAKAYDVKPKDVIFENPEVIDGISLNQVLKIPVKEIIKAKPA